MTQSLEAEPSPADKTVRAGGSSLSGTPRKQEAKEAQDERRERSTSSLPSPGSSGGRRGRSRTRHAGTAHTNAELVGGTAAERQYVYYFRVSRALNADLDCRGYHSLMSSFGKVFHVEKRWKLIREMGSGAYGYVM